MEYTWLTALTTPGYRSSLCQFILHRDVPEEIEGERTVRKSTRTSVIVRQAERDAIKAALQATMKPIKRKEEAGEKRMTQEEMLLGAAQTEIMNLRNLERVLAREEEGKRRAIVHKAVYSCSYLEFTKGASFQSDISTTPPPCKFLSIDMNCLLVKLMLRASAKNWCYSLSRFN